MRSRPLAGEAPLVATGTPYAVGPETCARSRRSAVPGVHAVPGLAGARLAAAGTAPRRIPWLNGDVGGVDLPAARPGAAQGPGRRACGEAGLADFLDAGARDTTATGTGPTSTPRAGCRARSSTARSTRDDAALTWRPPAAEEDGARGASSPSWPGASSTPTCCGTSPRLGAGTTCAPELRGCAYDDPERRRRRRGRQGRTGYPIVDAGMRQLLAEGWMHNRVRMITASFLTKDLHVWWPRRRAALPRPPGRRRHRLEQPRLAVGGGHRHRRLAVLPGVQPGHPGARSSTPTATTCGAGCPSCAHLRRRGGPRAVGRGRRATPTATPSGSSTTPPSGRGAAPATPPVRR